MVTCRKGHEYRGDENYRARHGKCPVCFRDVQRRYDQSANGRLRHVSYNHSDKGLDRHAAYNQSPKGWMNRLHDRRTKALERRKQRKEAEDS